VQGTKVGALVNQHTKQVHKCKKAMGGRVKCNIDTSFSISIYNQISIGICIRDKFGAYVLAKHEQFPMLCDVKIEEALRLPYALKWVHELNLGHVDFELDSKVVILCHIVNDFFLHVTITLVLSLSSDKQIRWLID
jgi:hypothetical protein